MGGARPSIMHDPVIRLEFAELWENGMTADKIAEEIGLSDERQVRKWRLKLKLPTRGLDWLKGKKRPQRRSTG